MILVVVDDPRWPLVHDGLGIRESNDAEVVAHDRANACFGHSIALRTFERRRCSFKTDAAREAVGIASDVEPPKSGSVRW